MSDTPDEGPVEIILEGQEPQTELTHDDPVEEADTDEATEKDDDASAESEDEEEESKDEPKDGRLRHPNGKFRTDAEAKIARATFLRREAERQRDDALAQLHRAQGAAKTDAEPNPDDFEDYRDFVKAAAKWEVTQERARNAEDDAKAANERANQHRNSEWGAKLGSVKDILPDFDAVMDKADTPTLPHVASAIMEADRGPELLYHLANNPDIVERLNDMSASRAAIELGRIEAGLETRTAPTPPPKKTTTAPPPITPVTAGSATTKDPSKMNMDEYTAFRKANGIYR